MAKATCSFMLSAALVCAGTLCSHPEWAVVRAAGAPPALEEGQSPDPCALGIGPVEGLTTRWHPAPSRSAVPAGKGVYFVLTKRIDGDVQWRNAVEILDDRWGSIAFCPLGPPGGVLLVQAQLYTDDGLAAERTCELAVSPVVPAEIACFVEWSAADLGLSDPPTNEQTRRAFYGESVAALTPIGPDEYLTGVDRTVVGRITSDRPEFLPLMEWRVDGVAASIGPEFECSFPDVGTARIEAGPIEAPRAISLQTYRTAIAMHSPSGFIYDDVPVAFTASTTPPGFEKHVRWLASTTYGSSEPVLGVGPDFTTTFHRTFEQKDDGSYLQWLGVKGDNDRHNQDAKVVCPLAFRYDGRDHVLVRNVFMLVDPVFRIGLDPLAPAPVIIVAQDDAGIDIPFSHVELRPGGEVLYGIENASTYEIRTTEQPGKGQICAAQPGELRGNDQATPKACGSSSPATAFGLVQGAGLLSFTVSNTSSCPAVVKFVNAADGAVLRQVTVLAGNTTAVEYRNTDSTITVRAEYDCTAVPKGTCKATISGRFFSAGDPAANEREFYPATGMSGSTCQVANVNEVLRTTYPGVYILSFTVPVASGNCPILVSASVGATVLASDVSVNQGKTFVLEINNSAGTGELVTVSFKCPTATGDCNATVAARRTVLTTVTHPPVAVAARPCGDTDGVLTTNARGIISITVNVGPGNVCPVEIGATRGGTDIVGFPVTVGPGNPLTVTITNPSDGLPATATDIIRITAKCTGAINAGCNYTLSSGRQPNP